MTLDNLIERISPWIPAPLVSKAEPACIISPVQALQPKTLSFLPLSRATKLTFCAAT